MNLENLGVQEMNAQEVKEVDGGLFGIDDFLLGVAVGAALAIINDWDNFKAGLSGEPPIQN